MKTRKWGQLALAVFDKRLTIVNPSHLLVALRTQICGSCHNRGKSTNFPRTLFVDCTFCIRLLEDVQGSGPALHGLRSSLYILPSGRANLHRVRSQKIQIPAKMYAHQSAQPGSHPLSAGKVFGEFPYQPDLVILDVIMPDMGRGETYDRMKEINPNTKVLPFPPPFYPVSLLPNRVFIICA